MPRKGFISASGVKPLMVNGKTKPPFGRGAVTYSRQLARVMAGIEKEEFESKDIDRGNNQEDEAIVCFERRFFTEIKRPGFMIHPEIDFFGGTPDGITSDYGIDIKCPNQKNHHDNLSEGIQLKDYKHQFQSYMSITGLNKWGLVSYNRSFTDKTKLVLAWMKRDDKYIKKLLDRVREFYPLVLEEYEELKNYKPPLL